MRAGSQLDINLLETVQDEVDDRDTDGAHRRAGGEGDHDAEGLIHVKEIHRQRRHQIHDLPDIIKERGKGEEEEDAQRGHDDRLEKEAQDGVLDTAVRPKAQHEIGREHHAVHDEGDRAHEAAAEEGDQEGRDVDEDDPLHIMRGLE